MRAVMIAMVVAACGGASTPHAPDAAPAPTIDAFASTCGKPGDTGNELGVGKFCATLGDCGNNGQAGLCSSFGDPSTFFCTKLCSMATGAADCGSATTCTCNAQNQCGCTPDACLM